MNKEQSFKRIKCHFERLKERICFDGRKFTPLYEKGVKENKNKSMETT